MQVHAPSVGGAPHANLGAGTGRRAGRVPHPGKSLAATPAGPSPGPHFSLGRRLWNGLECADGMRGPRGAEVKVRSRGVEAGPGAVTRST